MAYKVVGSFDSPAVAAITKRKVQIVLGLLWLLDGILQLQRQMFTKNFADNVIAPAGQGQPLIVSGPINFAVHIILWHPAIFDAGFAAIQIAIGILILTKLTVKFGLTLSMFWGLAVWYLGEGFGGILSARTLIIMGAPGAVIIYVLLALAVIPKSKKVEESKEANAPAYWLPLVWAAFWIGGAIYQVLPGQNTAQDIASMISANVGGGIPGWLGSLDLHLSRLISNQGTGFIVVLAITQLMIGLLALLPRFWLKLGITIGIVVSLLFWVFGQSFGQYFTGLATDPDSAPLFILLGVAILGCQRLKFRELYRNGFRSLEHFLT